MQTVPFLSGNTTNLMYHLQTAHPAEHKEIAQNKCDGKLTENAEKGFRQIIFSGCFSNKVRKQPLQDGGVTSGISCQGHLSTMYSRVFYFSTLCTDTGLQVQTFVMYPSFQSVDSY